MVYRLFTEAEMETYIEENINLLHSVARSYYNTGIEYEDIFQDVCEGAVKALQTYNPKRGSLSTYIVNCAKNQVNMMIRNRNTLSRSAVIISLEQYIPRDTEDAAFYSYLNKDLSAVDSLHTNSTDLVDTVYSRTLLQQICLLIEELLSPVQRNILLMHVNGFTQKDIAKKIGMTQGNVSKILRAATDRIRLNVTT